MVRLFITIFILFSSAYSKNNITSGKQIPNQVMYRSGTFEQVPDPTLSWVGSGFFSQYTTIRWNYYFPAQEKRGIK